MRVSSFPAVCLLVLLSLTTRAATENSAAAKKPSPSFVIGNGESPAEKSRFSDPQLALVQSWIKQAAPECPVESSTAVAENFLDELQRSDPGLITRLLTPEFQPAKYESALLRQVALKLGAAAPAGAKEALARRRLLALGVKDAAAPSGGGEIASLLAKIKDSSASQHRRLLDGRIEDDELILLVKRATQPSVAPKELAPLKAKELTAAEIVAEFARRNQTGNALQRLQGLIVEGKLTTATGEEQELLMFKMKPDAFRLVIRAGGQTRYLMAAIGGRFWQQSPGKPPQAVPQAALGQRLYLAEFSDPLFLPEEYTVQREADGSGADGQKFYRLKVQRKDGSGYIARIEPENFRQIGRENDDRTIASYGDFRMVGGVAYAFREEIKEEGGRTGVLAITRITPNPGLIAEFFAPPARSELGYFELEAALTANSDHKFTP